MINYNIIFVVVRIGSRGYSYNTFNLQVIIIYVSHYLIRNIICCKNKIHGYSYNNLLKIVVRIDTAFNIGAPLGSSSSSSNLGTGFTRECIRFRENCYLNKGRVLISCKMIAP